MELRITYLPLHSVGCCLHDKLHNSFSREEGFVPVGRILSSFKATENGVQEGDVMIDPHNIEMY